MKNLIKTICFFLILSVIIVLGGKVLMPKDNTKESGMYEADRTGYLTEKPNTIDVIYMGNSILYTSVAPTIIYENYGYTGFDISGNARKIDIIFYNLLHVLKTQKPKILVLEPETLLYRYDYDNLFTGLSEGIPFVKYHDRWKRISINDFTSNVNYTYKDIDKGFYHIKKIDGAKKENYMVKKRLDSDVQLIPTIYLDLIKKVCDDNDIKLLVVSVPVMTYTYERHNNIKSLMDSKGIDYIDLNYYNDEIGVDFNTDTKDKGKHLNYRGAYKVSKFLGNYLNSLNILTDHRSDPNYSFWNDDIAKYKEKYNE